MGYDNSKIEKLKIISKLYNEGVLTKEEMEAEKQKIMGNGTSASSTHREDTSEKVGTGESAEEDNEQANQAASNACGTKSEQNDSEGSAVHIEKVEDNPKFHLPTWAYCVIPTAVVLIIIGVIYLVKYSKEEAVEEVAMEETYDDGLPKRIYVNNSTTLDELFCDENVGDTIDNFEQGDLTHGGDYEDGPIATAIEHAEYVNCQKAGPRTGMKGVIKYNYKGQEDTYYCDGNTSAGCVTDPLIWVYNRKTKKLYAYLKPYMSFQELYNIFDRYRGKLNRAKSLGSLYIGGLNVNKEYEVTHKFSDYDECLGGPDIGTYYIYTSDNVKFDGCYFNKDGHEYIPNFNYDNTDEWVVVIFRDGQFGVDFYIPREDFFTMANMFTNDDPVEYVGDYNSDYYCRQYSNIDDRNCSIRFEHYQNIYSVHFWILGYD